MGKHVREGRKRRQEKRQMGRCRKAGTADIEIGEEKTRAGTQKNKDNAERQRTVGTLKIHRQVKSGEGSLQKERKRDFPGSPVAENTPSSPGDVGSVPARGTKILHAMVN